jgi:hypothetical protein
MERFVDLAPVQVWAERLDTGPLPPCSIRTMDRVLAANAEVRERNQLRNPAYLPHRRGARWRPPASCSAASRVLQSGPGLVIARSPTRWDG